MTGPQNPFGPVDEEARITRNAEYRDTIALLERTSSSGVCLEAGNHDAASLIQQGAAKLREQLALLLLRDVMAGGTL